MSGAGAGTVAWDPAIRTGPRPTSTYRLQLGPHLTLPDARDLVPYFDALGISHLYLSPILAAREGSSHGYDVIDPNRLNPALGTEADLRALADAVHERGMGVLLDIVPNHMAADTANPWWADVLRHGRASAYAHYFDIDWDAADGKLVLPVLGKPLEDVLAARELAIRAEAGHLHFAYYDHRFPLSRESEETALAGYGAAEHGAAASLAGLLEAQYYQLADWRRGAGTINYRRFFDITGLAALRVEDGDVFQAVHARVLAWVREGVVDALRIDHVDGLRDPAGYLQRLRAELPGAWILVEKILARGEHLPADWPVDGTTGYDTLNMLDGLFIDPEGLKKLRRTWHEHTGLPEDFDALAYDKKAMVLETLFPAELDGLLKRLRALAKADPDAPRPTPPTVPSEWAPGAAAAAPVPELPAGRTDPLREALVAITAALPVYRTYTRVDGDIAAADRTAIDAAAAAAAARLGVALRPEPDTRPDHAASAAAAAHGEDAPALDWLRRLLLLEVGESDPEARIEFVARWQQLTGPVMAKGVEDTALYVDGALLSACEVGSDPGHAAVSVEEYHAFMQDLRARTPLALTAASTHDAKRGEDVRARLNVLSWIPDEWAEHLARWRDWNAELAGGAGSGDGAAIAADEEIRLYQTLLGTWPFADDEGLALAVPPPPDYAGRVKRFMRKAAREAKLYTSWRDPDSAYEDALARLTDALLAKPADDPFMVDFLGFVNRLARAGADNSIEQTVLRLSGPGIPDIYQGAELWALSMVDPDNRRPVGWERRRALLDRLGDEGEASPASGGRGRAAEKLSHIERMLRRRRGSPPLRKPPTPPETGSA